MSLTSVQVQDGTPHSRWENPFTMASPTARFWLWPLVLLLCSTSVTSFRINYPRDTPKTFWVDASCEGKGFTPAQAQESLLLASRGANRLINLYDDYQAWVYKLLFKEERDFSINDYFVLMAWDVIGKTLLLLPLEMQYKILNRDQRIWSLDCRDEGRNRQRSCRRPDLLW